MNTAPLTINAAPSTNGHSPIKNLVRSPQTGATSQRHYPFSKRILKWCRAYMGALIATSVVAPIFCSVATVSFYISPLSSPSRLPPGIPLQWYAPVYGCMLTGIVILLFAIPRSLFATAEGANTHAYSLLKDGQSRLKARLDIQDDKNDPDGMPLPKTLAEMKAALGMTNDNEAALREAYVAYNDVCRTLCSSHGSLSWVSGEAYITTWRLIHHAEEALIEVEPMRAIMREAIHDYLAIQNSAIGNRDGLIAKLIEAISNLDSEALAYFEEDQPGKTYAALMQQLKQQGKERDQLLHQVVNVINPLVPADKKINLREEKDAQPPLDPKIEERARVALREVKHALNDFREARREGLVLARNHLSVSIALTGFATHVLLCIVILLKPDLAVMQAATAYYLTGALAGLFGRFYNESNNGTAGHDYGLFTARLIAVPLLSGLAGIGGAIVTELIPMLNGSSPLPLANLFTLDSRLLLAAAVFGFTPNLLIRSFQQRSQKYAADLESTKGSEAASDT